MISRGDATRGHQLATAASAVLVGVMGARYLRTKKVVPAGVLTGAGVASLGYNGMKTWEWMDAERDDEPLGSK